MNQIPEPGLYRMTNEQYHAVEAFSNTGAKAFLKSPAHFKALTEGPPEVKAAWNFGDAFHSYTIEPVRFAQSFAIKPDGMSFATKEGKAWKAENQGKIVIPKSGAESFESIKAMGNAVRTHPTVNEFFPDKNNELELAAFWQDPTHGFLCKAKFDILNKAKDILCDLKTTIDASPQYFYFQNKAYNLGYHTQARHYLDGIQSLTGKKVKFKLVAVEKKYPWAIKVFSFSQAMLDLAEDTLNAIKVDYKNCLETNSWPAYPVDEFEIDIPAFKKGGKLTQIIE